MPPARNQEVTVRRPEAKRMPYSSTGRRAAEAACSQWASWKKALVSRGGRYNNDMVGSLTRGFLSKSHRVQGAGSCPPTCGIRYSTPTRLLPLIRSLLGADV